MLTNTEINSESDRILVATQDKLRKQYHKPFLGELGDLRALTLAASTGTFPDSGSTIEFPTWDPYT
jgi:hypothetical protein